MTLLGGPADKLGNRYEQWWTVYQLTRILFGEAQSIRIEDPSVDKAEFVLTTDHGDELHQNKRDSSSGSWSLAQLCNKQNKIIQAICKQLAGNSRKFFFVSGSDAPELRELSKRSRDAASQAEYKTYFLASKAKAQKFDKMVELSGCSSTSSVYDILQRIHIRRLDEKAIIDLVNASIKTLFLSKHKAVCDHLRTLVLDSVHKSLNREDLVSSLNNAGHHLRNILEPSDTPTIISETTDRHIRSLQRKLINRKIIPRSVSQQCVQIVQNNHDGVNLVLTGKAGGGKTACVLECIERLQESATEPVVLSFRVDRLPTVRNTRELGEFLGLEESPALVLEAALNQTGSSGILIIDQLDAISMTSGRNTELFDVVEDLIHEIQALRTHSRIDLLIVCRAFDWENDHRFRKLFSEKSTKLEIDDFSLEEVKEQLSLASFPVHKFSEKQLSLLQTPQNLSVFFDAKILQEAAPEFFSSRDLFDLYWQTKRLAVSERSSQNLDLWVEILQLITDEMTQSQKLSINKERLDQFSEQYLNQMVSEGVLVLLRNPPSPKVVMF